MYKVFNMGHRFEIYTSQGIASEIIDIAAGFNLEAKVIGHCEASEKKEADNHVRIRDFRILGGLIFLLNPPLAPTLWSGQALPGGEPKKAISHITYNTRLLCLCAFVPFFLSLHPENFLLWQTI